MAANVVFFLVRNNELTERTKLLWGRDTAFGTERMQFEVSFLLKVIPNS